MSAISMWKLERGCADCGYDKSPHALDFDHPPGVEKETEVSKLYRFKAPIEKIIAEMEKCEVVCANCHRIRTVERGGWGQ